MIKKLLLIPFIFILSLLTVNAQIGNISDSITGDFIFDAVVGASGAFPDMLTINENITAITYTGSGNDGFVATVNISNTNGSIFNVIDSFEWDSANGLESKIIPVNDITYAIVSRGSTGDGFIDTVNISSNGTILQSVVSTFEFDTGDGNFPDIIKVDGTVFAIAYRGADTDGFVATINIDSAGIITPAVLDIFEFDVINANQVDIFNITKNTYALVYEGGSPLNSKLKTINISSNGTILKTELSELIFDSAPATDGKMLRIGQATTTYAVAYESLSSNGTIKTFEILNNGTIVQLLDSLQFDATGTDIDVINVDENVIAIAYQGAGNDGFVKTFNIADSGTIGSEIDALEFDLIQVEQVSITRLTSEIYAVAYEDFSTQGLIKTFNISSIEIPVPAVPPQALLIKELFLPNSSTSSSTFQTIGTATVNLTRLSDIDAIVSFTARREGGTGEDNYTWRFLIDDVAGEQNITRSLTVGDRGSVVFSNDRNDLPTGLHNISFQHLSSDGTLFTENIDIVVNLHLTENNTRIGHVSGEVDTVISSTDFVELSTGEMNVSETGMVMMASTFETQSTDENTVEFIVEFNNENSSSFRRRMEAATDVASIGYLWQYNNVANGTRIWRLWGKNSESVSTSLEGHIDLDQMVNDNVPTTMSHFSNGTTRIDTQNVFIQIANVTIPTVRNNSVYVAAAFTVNIENQGGVERNVSYILQSDGLNSQQLSRSMSNVDDIGNLFIQHVFNDSDITHNVSLLVASELGGGRILVVTNVSMFAMEVIDFESVITIPEVDTTPPAITLVTPANNTATNTIPLNITFTVTDGTAGNIICEFRNLTNQFDSGTFQQAVNNNVTLAEGSMSLSQEFPFLNLSCFDNSVNNNSATMILNYTLDTIPPVIIAILPLNKTEFNKALVTNINIQANCTDVPVFRFNITISNETDVVATFEDVTPVNDVLTINENLDISGLAPDLYTMDYVCSDTHTTKEIPNYNIRKNLSSYEIKWVATDLNEVRIKYLQNSLPINEFGSEKKGEDRYNFYFITNESETKTKRTFIFEITSGKEVYYIENSEYKGHFITGNNWIDFELGDDNAEYLVTKNAKGNYEIEVTTTKTSLDFSSIGELNLNFLQTEFRITFTGQIKDDTYSLLTCPLENLQRTILFMFFIVLSFGIMIIGFNWQNGLIGFMGAMLLLILSAFTYACIIAVGIILTGLAILFISFFVIKGTRNFN